jgi:hypothetical protein
MPTLSKSQTAKAVHRLAAIAAKCDELYAERDALEAKIIEAVQASRTGSIPLSDGSVVTLKNNFEDRDGIIRNVAFKNACVQHYKIVIKSGA